jgi:hypothetical protein
MTILIVLLITGILIAGAGNYSRERKSRKFWAGVDKKQRLLVHGDAVQRTLKRLSL